MNVWFSSDLHLGHARIIELSGRPYETVEEMNDDLIARWNSLVDPNDLVMILGDLAMGRLDDSLARCRELAGRKSLLPGNHDRPWRHYDSRYTAQPERREAARARYTDVGVDVIDAEAAFTVLRHPMVEVRMCHFPYEGDHTADVRYVEHRPIFDPEQPWLLHGHVHDAWRQRGHQINVGVDAWGGYPVHADTLAAYIEHDIDWLEPLPWER